MIVTCVFSWSNTEPDMGYLSCMQMNTPHQAQNMTVSNIAYTKPCTPCKLLNFYWFPVDCLIWFKLANIAHKSLHLLHTHLTLPLITFIFISLLVHSVRSTDLKLLDCTSSKAVFLSVPPSVALPSCFLNKTPLNWNSSSSSVDYYKHSLKTRFCHIPAQIVCFRCLTFIYDIDSTFTMANLLIWIK